MVFCQIIIHGNRETEQNAVRPFAAPNTPTLTH